MDSSTIQWLVVIALSVIIYNDAAKHKIGKVKDRNSFLNVSAGVWGASTIFLAIIIVPIYLIFRRKLIETAKENTKDLPVEISMTQRVIVSAGLIFIGLVCMGVSILISNVPTVQNLPKI